MGRERVPLKPGWVNTDLPREFYFDTDYLKIFGFYVVHALRPNRSSKGKLITDYGWPRDVWKASSSVSLKDVLLYVADLHMRSPIYDIVTREPVLAETFAVSQKHDGVCEACNRAGVPEEFTRIRGANRIAVYNSEDNAMLSVFDHIRNAFAHGRFTIYNDGFIALESGKSVYDSEKGKNLFDVRGRMILKKETLITWISIIESGKLDDKIVREIENKRNKAKEERKMNRKKSKDTECRM